MPDDTPGIGHNSDEFQSLRDRINDFGQTAKEWGQNGCETEDDERRLNAFISEARQLSKDIEAMRKAEKAPHDAAIKDIQGRYKPMVNLAKQATDIAKELLGSYLRKRQAEADERARQERAAAEEAAKKAAEEAADAEARGDLLGAAEKAKQADEAEKQAEKSTAEKVASRGDGATVSMRKRRVVKIVSIRSAMLHFENHPEMESLITKLARADYMSGAEKVPGTIVEIEEYAA
ncbi:MAG: hypothetical protein AAGE80_05575 [Pseudomonadota bacterium]